MASKAPLPDGALEERPVVLPLSHLKWSKGFEKAISLSGWMDVKSNRLHSALYSLLQMTISKHTLLPVVLFVPVMLQRVVIDQVEEEHASSSQLKSVKFSKMHLELSIEKWKIEKNLILRTWSRGVIPQCLGSWYLWFHRQ